MLEIFQFFSRKISQILKENLRGQLLEELEEIRIRSNGSIALKFTKKQEILIHKTFC